MAKQDRSLGTAELRISELARESSTDPQYRHESIGKKEAWDPIKLNGDSYQGQLHYVAEFIPSLALKDVHFDEDESELQKAAKTSDGLNGDIRVAGTQPIGTDSPQGAKADGAAANGTTNGTSSAADTEPKAEGEEKEESIKDSGLELSKDELLKHRAYDYCCDILQLTCFQNLALFSSMLCLESCTRSPASRCSWTMAIGLRLAPSRHRVYMRNGSTSERHS